MPENRKYLPEEITYVISRVLAGWKHEAIAEAFKRDHAPYWDHKEFTKKQVSYIRNTYKIPPGSIEPYQEPEPELQHQQSIAAISPLTRLLMMDHPTPQHNDIVAGGQDIYKNHLEGGEVALLDWSNNNNNNNIQPESVSHQYHQPGFYNAATANTGFTTVAPQSFGTQVSNNVDLNACNDPTIFKGGFGAGGMGSTRMNHPDANEGSQGNGGNLFDQTVHGIGEQFNNNNANTSDDNAPVLNAEDQAFLEEMFPTIHNEQQITNTNNVQMVASARQGVSTPTNFANQPQREQPQAQEDTVMHSVESETVDLTDDGEAQATTTTCAAAAVVPVTTITNNAGPERPIQRSGQRLTLNLSNLPATVCKNPSPMTVEAIHAQTVPISASRFRRGGSSRVVDFYFGPHGNCPIPREHGHNSIDGSIVFRSEAKLQESFAAMQDHEGASYRLGLADGIDQGLQSVMNLANSTFNNNDNKNNPPPAAAVQTQTLAFDQMYHRARETNHLNAIGVLGSQVTPRPARIAPGQSRPAAWRRAQNNEYYDAYTGNNLDYQRILLGNRRASQAQSDNGGDGSNFGGGGGDNALRHRQNQQLLLQHSSPPQEGGKFDLYTGDQDMRSLVFHPYHPQGAAPASPRHHAFAYHSPANSVPSTPTDFGGLAVANGGTHTSGFGNGYSSNNNFSFGQNGGAFGGHLPSPGMTHPQHEALQARNYQSAGFYQQQHGGPVPDVYTPQLAVSQQQQRQQGTRPGSSAHHPMNLDGAGYNDASYPVEHDKGGNNDQDDDGFGYVPQP